MIDDAFRREVEAMREWAEREEVRADFRSSAAVVEAWERANPTTLESVLDWIDQLRGLFGDFPTDRDPWRGDDFRL